MNSDGLVRPPASCYRGGAQRSGADPTRGSQIARHARSPGPCGWHSPQDPGVTTRPTAHTYQVLDLGARHAGGQAQVSARERASGARAAVVDSGADRCVRQQAGTAGDRNATTRYASSVRVMPATAACAATADGVAGMLRATAMAPAARSNRSVVPARCSSTFSSVGAGDVDRRDVVSVSFQVIRTVAVGGNSVQALSIRTGGRAQAPFAAEDNGGVYRSGRGPALDPISEKPYWRSNWRQAIRSHQSNAAERLWWCGGR